MIDLHLHVTPESRGIDGTNALQAAQLAKVFGLRAILLKNHDTETASHAYLVRQVVSGIEVYGGIVLNRSVGGINPAAVERMVAATGGFGRIVWLPTLDSEHSAPGADNVSITRNGELLPEVRELFAVIREHDLALATGHVSPEEALLVVREAKAAGIDRILVSHPTSEGVEMSIEMQKEAARLGALLEYTVLSVVNSEIDEFAAQVREVGPENVVLTTDLGQPENPPPADGLRTMIPRLEVAGFSFAEIDMMTKQNPARLLGLD